MKQKILLLILFAGIITVNAFAQPTIRGQKAIGGSGDDIFSCMSQTKDGGLIMGGYSSSNISGEKTENNRGLNPYSTDYWVIKMDSTSKIQWDKTVGGDNNDKLTSLQQTSDGGYILGGYSNSNISGEKTENSRGYSEDYWIVKLDSTHKIQWDETIGGNDNDELYSLQQTSDGGYILGGYSSSNISGEKTENSRGSTDYWLVKLDKNGKIEWDKTIGGSGGDVFASLQQTGDGGYILGGYSNSDISGEKTENSRGGLDYWIVKLDNTGKIQWDKTIGGSGEEFFTSIQQTNDGGYILGGRSYSDISGEKTENSRGDADYWIVKLDKNGKVEWDKTIGGNDGEDLYSLQQTVDGGYISGGDSYSNISGEKTENSIGEGDYWIVKLNKNGILEWDKTIGGQEADVCYSIKEASRNHYIIGGYSRSPISGDKTAYLRGGYDYWGLILVYKKPGSFEITGLQSEDNIVTQKITSNNFIVYPNPAKDAVHVQIVGTAVISLTDQSGKILLTQTINRSGVINVVGLNPGLYYLKNTVTGAVQKVIVSR